MALRITGLLRAGRANQFRPPSNAVCSVRQRSVGRFETAVNNTWDRLSGKFRNLESWKRFKKITGMDQPLINLGDYPRLPAISNQELPTYGWWDNFECRNKNTIVHESYDSISVWVYDIYPIRDQENTRLWMYLYWLALSVGSFYLMFLALKYSVGLGGESDFVAKRFPHGNLYLERGGDTTYPNGYFPSGPPFMSDPVNL